MNASPPVAEQARRLRDQAIQYIRSNQTRAAQESLEALIQLQPQDLPVYLELANLMTHHGQFRASSAPLLEAVRHLSGDAPAILGLTDDLNMRGDVVAARACLDHLSRMPDLTAETLAKLAWHRHRLGEVDVALDVMQQALAAGADAPDNHLFHATLLVYAGRSEAARKVLEACLERWPDFGHAAAVLMVISKQTPDDNRLAYVEEQLGKLPARASDDVTRANVAEFEFARFRILHDLGRYAEAWPSLLRSKEPMNEFNPYDAPAQQALVDALVGMPPMRPGKHVPAAVDDGPVPIFIVGLPRSGSTLMDRMLSAHSQVASAGELIVFWRELHWVADVPTAGLDSLRHIAGHIAEVDLEAVGRRYIENMGWLARGRRYFVDKLPANIQTVPLIRAALPQARIINMVRDPMDVCLSNFQLYGHQSTYVNSLEAIADFHRLHQRLCSRWRELAPDMMLDVVYEDLARDPVAVMRRVLEYCGLEVEENCLHPERNAASVATPSSQQVREPIHTRSIGRWKAYAGQLEPLRQALG